MPGLLVCTDIVRPWSKTLFGYRHILSMVISCSRQFMAIPKKQAKINDVEKLVLKCETTLKEGWGMRKTMTY